MVIEKRKSSKPLFIANIHQKRKKEEQNKSKKKQNQ